MDDEIGHLKPHILFLEEKGYNITPCTNGQDGIALSQKTDFDLILLDQFMPGLDGLETLREIKEIRPSLPIIMITKSEEEWLMDEAISEKVVQFLIKPVNPTQIFIACKQVLEEDRIRSEKAASGYLKGFQEIEFRLRDDLSVDDWWELYNRLVRWQLDFDAHRDFDLSNILKEQIQACNREFAYFIEKNYRVWLWNKDRPVLSPDVFPTHVAPILKKNQKVCFLVVDGMRQDQFTTLLPLLSQSFHVDIFPSLSILPTATPFSRNAIFSGLFPDEFCKRNPEQLKLMKADSGSLNLLEESMLKNQMNRLGLGQKSYHYHKIWQAEEGQKFQSRIGEYLQIDLLAVVVNFVDQLAHRRSESDVLKEMVPDESGYRMAVRTWFEQSWLVPLLAKLKDAGFKIVITSDHGSIMVNRGAMVGADKEVSSGVRYKYGRNLNTSKKNAFTIREPEEYHLPLLGHQTNYIMARDDVFFLYPNQQHHYAARLKGSFQHGGISMEEMLVPVLVLEGK